MTTVRRRRLDDGQTPRSKRSDVQHTRLVLDVPRHTSSWFNSDVRPLLCYLFMVPLNIRRHNARVVEPSCNSVVYLNSFFLKPYAIGTCYQETRQTMKPWIPSRNTKVQIWHQNSRLLVRMHSILVRSAITFICVKLHYIWT